MIRCKPLATTVALAVSWLAFGASASAQGTAPSAASAAISGSGMTAKGDVPSRADQQFVMEAAKGGMAEVALGQLAQQKGGSDTVKQFGAKMVEDHTQANDELKQLASAKGVKLPASMPKDPNAQKLESMTGASFDRAYMTQMHVDHKKTVALFQKESTRGADPDLKAFATKTLPTLQAHLQMVESDLHAAGGATKH